MINQPYMPKYATKQLSPKSWQVLEDGIHLILDNATHQQALRLVRDKTKSMYRKILMKQGK